jgi:hypothetical protein
VADLVTEAEVTAAWPGFANLSSTAKTMLLSAASDAVRNHTRRDWGTGSTTETHDGSGTPRLFLKRYPTSSVTTITVNGTAETDYVLDASRGIVTRGDGEIDPRWSPVWDAGTQNIDVAYTASVTVPDQVKWATISMVREMWVRTSTAALKREKLGDYEREFSGGEVTLYGRIPSWIDALLAPYCDWRQG